MRVPDVKIRKKRMKTVVLSEEAFLVYKQIRENTSKLGSKWDFSDFVSKVLVDRFGSRGVHKRELLIRDINLLQDERKRELDRLEADFDERIRFLASKLNALNAEYESEVIKEV